MSTQTSQLVGFIDPAYGQQQPQQNFQVSPQQIQRLRHLQQQSALQHQQAGYAPQLMTLPQYHHHQQQQQSPPMQQQQQPYEQSLNPTMESSDQPSSPEEKVQTKAARRAEHNAIERARREHLNTKFQQLAHSLPNLQNDRRPSKGTIIERTLEFVKHTVQKEERYKNEIRELSRANRHLMRQVTSRSSILAGSNSVGADEEDDEDDDDVPDDMLDYDVDDGMDMITTTDDTLSRKSSCSSFAMQSLSSAPTTVGGNSSTTTSPSLDYRSMMGQWDTAQQQQQQQQYHYYQQQQQQQQRPSNPYLSNEGYFLPHSHMDPSAMKPTMGMMNSNNLHIEYETPFPC